MSRYFKCKGLELSDDTATVLCGILNVTPDSFSDGGRYNSLEQAYNRALEMVNDGVQIIDIGGESTRPGAEKVSVEEEINRVCPLIQAIRQDARFHDVLFSVDTWKADVAEKAALSGVDIINDITGLLGDEKMATVIARHQLGLIIMFNPVIFRPHHEASKNFNNFNIPRIYKEEEYKEHIHMPITEAMLKYFDKSLEIASLHNIPHSSILLDMGIGFGMSKRENLQLLNKIELIHQMGFCSFLGVSRKRFIVNLLSENGFDADKDTLSGLENLDYASSFLTAIQTHKGVNVLRVHDVKKHQEAKIIADAIRFADNTENIIFKGYQ